MLLQISLRKVFAFVNCFVRETMCNGERPVCLCSARNLKSRLASLETLLWRFLTVFLDFVAAFSNHLMRKEAWAKILALISFVFKRLNWRMVFLKTDAKSFVFHFSDSNTSWWPIREKWISFASRLQRKVRLVNSFCRCFPQNGKRVGGGGREGEFVLTKISPVSFFSFFPGPCIQTSYWLFFSCA